MIAVLAREPFPLRRYLIEEKNSLLHMSLWGRKAPHRDGLGYAYLDPEGEWHGPLRWGKGELQGMEGIPGPVDEEAILLIAHARKSSPEFRDLAEATYSHPMEADGVILAHNGTLWDHRSLWREADTDTQAIVHWLSHHWYPRTTGRLIGTLRELLEKALDYTALNLLLSARGYLYAFCCYSRDPDYYTLRYRESDGRVVVASEPGTGSWKLIPNRTLLVVDPRLRLSLLEV